MPGLHFHPRFSGPLSVMPRYTVTVWLTPKRIGSHNIDLHPNQMKLNPSADRGFTLTELLLVIAIIAVLAALLLRAVL
jgi:prepilin-type N-terminal cleavage/methylation domain-containing protein